MAEKIQVRGWWCKVHDRLFGLHDHGEVTHMHQVDKVISVADVREALLEKMHTLCVVDGGCPCGSCVLGESLLDRLPE